jgi:hypothetical protein
MLSITPTAPGFRTGFLRWHESAYVHKPIGFWISLGSRSYAIAFRKVH